MLRQKVLQTALFHHQTAPFLQVYLITQVFLQADSLAIYFFRSLFTHISIMPRFIGNSGNLCLILGIPEDKAVFITVLHQPLPDIRGAPASIVIHADIDCQTHLMFAGSRHRHPLFRHFSGFRLRIALGNVILNFLVHQGLLNFIGSIPGIDIGFKPLRLMEGTPVRYIPVDIEEFSSNKLRRLEQVKQFLKEQLPVRTEAMEGYITIQGDVHIADKIRCMLEQAVYRIYFSGENRTVDSYRHILEQRAAEGLKVVVITNPPYELPKARIYLSRRKPGQVGVIIDSATVLTGDVGNGEQSACLYSGKKNLVDLFKDSLSNEIKIIELTERNESK